MNLTWQTFEEVPDQHTENARCGLCRRPAFFSGLYPEIPAETLEEAGKTRIATAISDGDGIIVFCENCIYQVHRYIYADEQTYPESYHDRESEAANVTRLRRFLNAQGQNHRLSEAIGDCCACGKEAYLSSLLVTSWARQGADNTKIVEDTFESLLSSALDQFTPAQAAELSLIARRYICVICKECEKTLKAAAYDKDFQTVCAGPPNHPARIPIGEIMPRGESAKFESLHAVDGIRDSEEYKVALAQFQEYDKRQSDAQELLAKTVKIDKDGLGPNGIYVGAIARLQADLYYVGGIVGYVSGFGVAVNIENDSDHRSTIELSLPVIIPAEQGPVWVSHTIFADQVEIIKNEPLGIDLLEKILEDQEDMPTLNQFIEEWQVGNRA